MEIFTAQIVAFLLIVRICIFCGRWSSHLRTSRRREQRCG